MSVSPGPDQFEAPQIRLRGLEARDQQAHAAHLLRLSPASRRARFHSALNDGAVISYSQQIDWQHALIFGAFVDGMLRGVGELIPYPDRDEGEASFSIETDFQHMGIGKRLVLLTLLAARSSGLTRMHMDFIGDNQAMRRLARDVGAISGYSEGVVHAVKVIPPRPSQAGRGRVTSPLS